jgi:hypothetical protein
MFKVMLTANMIKHYHDCWALCFICIHSIFISTLHRTIIIILMAQEYGKHMENKLWCLRNLPQVTQIMCDKISYKKHSEKAKPRQSGLIARLQNYHYNGHGLVLC